MYNKKRILILAAHADDEIIGCGGTMAKHIDAGDDVSVLFLTDGVGGRGIGNDDSQNIILRDRAAQKAASIIGFKLLQRFDFPDNAMDSLSRIEITKAVESVILKYEPNIIYTSHGGDLNVDHRRALEVVMTACRPQPKTNVNTICSFELASSTGWAGVSLTKHFTPNYYVEITPEQLDRKIQALRAYHIEMRNFPHARSIEAIEHLAKWRGSQVGVQAAEAFVLERALF